MAEAPPDAQHFLECDNCDVRPAKHHCSNCDGDLCDQCKDEHLRKKLSKNHSIIPIRLSRKQNQSDYCMCTEHHKQIYEFYCNDCQMPACLICFKEKHFQHSFENIDTAFATRKQALLKDLREVEDVLIPKHESMLKNLRENYQRAEEKDNEIQDEMRKLTAEIVSTFQQYLEKSLTCVSENRKANGTVFKESEEEMISKINKLKEIAQGIKSKVEAYEGKSIGNIWIKVPTLSDFQQQSNVVSFSPAKFTKGEFSPQSVPSQFGSYVAGKSFKKRLELISAFPSLTSPIYFIDHGSSDKIWVSGDSDDIILFDLHGNKLNTIKTETEMGLPTGLGVMKDKSVIYSDYLNKRIKRVISNKKHQTFIRTDWHPVGIFVTFAGNVLVSTRVSPFIGDREQEGKICRYGQDGKLQLTVNGKDEEGNPLFRVPDDVCENVNGDICVSDSNRITIVSMKGQLKFTYSGNKTQPFSPQGICTDSMGNILVPNEKDNSVHMLNENGEFLAYLLIKEDGIDNPNPLHFDTEGRLWLAEQDSGLIKVYSYYNA